MLVRSTSTLSVALHIIALRYDALGFSPGRFIVQCAAMFFLNYILSYYLYRAMPRSYLLAQVA
jgi:hypothetical protein